MSALTVRDVHKRFGATEVLKGINLEIGSGEFTVLVGPSGCGKSTLLNIIAGLERQSSGTVEIGGRIVDDVAPKDRDIAMVFQSYALYPSMTVRQNITFGMECRNVPKAEQEAALANVARLLQIEPLLDRKPSQLSGGQRQRVAMGRALVRDPLLFLFDEPLSNLDAKLRVEMRMEIKRLHQRIGATIVYVTHDQIEAMTHGDADRRDASGRGAAIRRPGHGVPLSGQSVRRAFHGRAADEHDAGTARGGRRRAGGRDRRRAAGRGPPSACRDTTQRRPLSAARSCSGSGRNASPRAAAVFRRTGAPIVVDAPVEMIEPTGAETIVLLRLGGEPVLARIAPDIRPVPGALASFALDTRRICLFDPPRSV